MYSTHASCMSVPFLPGVPSVPGAPSSPSSPFGPEWSRRVCELSRSHLKQLILSECGVCQLVQTNVSTFNTYYLANTLQIALT